MKKMQAGGVTSKMKKAPMVDANGAFTKVQERTLGKYMNPKAKNGVKMTKSKNSKSFPDLSKDGKITQKDILMAKGVIPKKSSKAMYGKTVKAQSGTRVKKMMGGGKCRSGC
jgi:hypothetical protein